MRIIAGSLRGRPLATPEGLATRPTSSRARQALFDILTHRPPGLEGRHVVDLFAGSGALGLEALSRGAASVVMVEKDRAAAAVIRHNIEKLGVERSATLLVADATKLPRARRAYDLVLADPPWGESVVPAVLRGLAAGGWLAADGLVVLEQRFDSDIVPEPPFAIVDERRYGKTSFVFLARAEASAPDAPAD